MTSRMTSTTPTGTSENLKLSTQLNTLSAAGTSGPWTRPELERSADYVLDSLRETKHMINSLQEREKRLKAEVGQLHAQGKLDHLVDADDPQKFNGDGMSISLCTGKKKRVYDAAVQMEIDVKQAEIDKIKYVADRKQQFEDTYGPSYWRVSVAKDEVL